MNKNHPRRWLGKVRKAYLVCSILTGSALLASAGLLAQVSDAASNVVNGRAVYAESCAMCHGATLGGGPGGPALMGSAFSAKWGGQPRESFLRYIRETMPLGGGGSLSDRSYSDVAAFIMSANAGTPNNVPKAPEAADGHAAGPRSESLDAKLIDAPAARTRELERQATLGRLRPVTDAMLRHPSEGDWLHWRRTYDGQGFSTLDQINRGNVARLQPKWSWQLAPGNNEITPLVHDGVLFIMSSNRLDALNAATGDLLWQYSRSGNGGILRNLAIYDDRIYLAAETSVVALDMRSGKVAWEKTIAPGGNTIKVSGGPLAVKGKILQGMSFCVAADPSGCFVVALDARTGEEAWRFRTIARPGEPGGDTWNGLPMERRAGASVWLAGSYDPGLDLFFFGTGQTYQTDDLMRGANRAAALYTDTTLALRPETGELAWYFQHQDGDVWDLDWSFERVLANIKVNGAVRRTVTTGGKIGLFDTLDAATGKYLFSTDVGSQTLITGIDPATGRKRIDPAVVPLPGKLADFCPGTLGGRNWPSTALNPRTNVMFVPFNDTCARLGPNLSQEGGGGVLPDTRDSERRVGRIQAIDLTTRKTIWTRRERSPQASAILATAGGLIFEGNRDRWFRASDDRTGKVIWQIRLNASPSSYPITYSVDGIQYVAVTTGGGNFTDTLIGRLTPEIVTTSGQPTLWIFRLPGRQK